MAAVCFDHGASEGMHTVRATRFFERHVDDLSFHSAKQKYVSRPRDWPSSGIDLWVAEVRIDLDGAASEYRLRLHRAENQGRMYGVHALRI